MPAGSRRRSTVASRSAPSERASTGFQPPPYTLALLLVVFAALGMPWMMADVWFDEYLTLFVYAVGERVGTVFSDYTVANNHMLYSALLWLWMQIAPWDVELSLRLPNLLIACATLVVMYRIGCLLRGRAAGTALMALLAFSPIYLSFFYQLRGYGLTLLLASLATLGAFHVLAGRQRWGLVLLLSSLLTLPMVVPTNVVVNAALWLVLAISLKPGRRAFWPLLAAAVASLLGMLMYWPVRDQFLQVARETSGWPSGWSVLGHWLVALAIHAGFFLLACRLLARGSTAFPAESDAPEPGVPELNAALWRLAACCLLLLAAAALVRAPFPRVLLGLLVPLNVTVLLAWRPQVARNAVTFSLLLLAIFGSSVLVTQWSLRTTRASLLAGRMPQDLLRQYYARNTDVSRTLRALAAAGIGRQQDKFYVDYHLYLPAQMYWRGTGGELGQVRCFNLPEAAPATEADLGVEPRWILAYNRDQAVAAYESTCRVNATVEAVDSPTAWRIYRVVAAEPAADAATRPVAVPPDFNLPEPLSP